nr:MAG TPA: hypothetical protein [Caudoviricetes sp.]
MLILHGIIIIKPIKKEHRNMQRIWQTGMKKN